MCIIYEPRGKAKEYADLAVNIYKGCSHGCVYCYAPAATFKKRDVFVNNPCPRIDVIEKLKKDAVKFKDDERNVLLSFTSDIYQQLNTDLNLARKTIEILNGKNISVTVLTKGGMRATADFDILKLNKKNNFAVSLTSDDPEESLKWEPGAALPEERIKSLEIAHDIGITTWVSFEPVINVEAVYRMIERTHKFVDLYKVGKLNYNSHSKTIDWAEFLINVELVLKKFNKPYYIKKDLEAYRTKTAA